MFDGLWTVEFRSTNNDYGRGVVVINQNRILGGDDGYYYTGTCDINNNTIQGSINIIRYDVNSISVFGNIDHFELNIEGDINENQFTLVGNIDEIPDVQIRVIGSKKEDFQQ